MTTMALLGDSQVGGIADFLGDALRARGRRTLNAVHMNGASARLLIDSGALERALVQRPEELVVFAGGNGGVSPTSWGELVNIATGRGVRRVIWVGPPAAAPGQDSVDAGRLAVSNAQEDFFRTKPAVRWISGRTTASGLPRADDVHLTAAGYRAWASRLAPVMTSSGGVAALAAAFGLTYAAWKLAQWMAR